MATTTQVQKIKLNKMTKAHYDEITPVATELYVLTDVLDSQYDVLPTAEAKYENQVTQYIGETTTDYINGYFYKCVAQDTDPVVYVWEQVNVQPGSSYTAGNGISITDGEISVTDPVLKNTAKNQSLSLCIFGNDTTFNQPFSVWLGKNAGPKDGTSSNSVAVGYNAKASSGATSVGADTSASAVNSVALGYYVKSTAVRAIQLGYNGTNADADTFKVSNINGNFEIMSADGTIPEARLADTTSATAGQVLKLDSNLNAIWADGGSGGESIQVEVLPTPSSSLVGKIYQYIGETTSNYINGYFYQCKEHQYGGPERVDISDIRGDFTAEVTNITKYKNNFLSSGTVKFTLREMSFGPDVFRDWEYETETGMMGGVSEDYLENGYGIKVTSSISPLDGDSFKTTYVPEEPIVYDYTWDAIPVDIREIPNQTGQQGKFLTTDGTNVSWTNDGITSIQVSELPRLSEDIYGKIYQYVGEDEYTMDMTYENGCFYKCEKILNQLNYTSSSGDEIYEYDRVEFLAFIQSITAYYGVINFPLTITPVNVSAEDGIVNISFRTYSTITIKNVPISAMGIGLNITGTLTINSYTTKLGWVPYSPDGYGIINPGWRAICGKYNYAAKEGTVLGKNSWVASYALAIGESTQASGKYSIAIANDAEALAERAIQIGEGTNNNPKTLSIGFGQTVSGSKVSYELLSSDGTIPEARLANTSSATAGQVLKLDSNLNAVWGEAGGGSGGGLPEQSGHAGEFLTTDGTNASWASALINKRLSDQAYDLVIGDNASANGANEGATAIGQNAESNSKGTSVGFSAIARSRGTAIGNNAVASGTYSTAIGMTSIAKANNAVQIGVGYNGNDVINNDANTFKFGNANGNFEIISANGTIPVDRMTNIISDSSTTATNQTWSASKLNTVIGDIESLLANI